MDAQEHAQGIATVDVRAVAQLVKAPVVAVAIIPANQLAKALVAVVVKPRVIQPTVNKLDVRGPNLPNYFVIKDSAYWHVSLSRYE